jgi:hypothetical protein
VPVSEEEWADLVHGAAMAGDADALRLLFADATRLFGADAGRRWADALSAYDSSAVTG